jgi:hypothetical protein
MPFSVTKNERLMLAILATLFAIVLWLTML